VIEQPAFLPLDLLPAGGTLPLVAYFPASLLTSVDARLQGSGELISALPSPDDGRYLPAVLENIKVLLDEDRRSAVISGEALLKTEAQPASRVWAAAVAYNASGEVVGVRRWENPPGQQLDSQNPLAVTLHVYSAGDEIERVDMYIEARP
jgi:hypothetical protein